jgi:hypothetical protein
VRENINRDLNFSSPYRFEVMKSRIEIMTSDQRGRFIVLQMPNITHVFYGRMSAMRLNRSG